MGIFIPSFPRGFGATSGYRKGPRKTYPKAPSFMFKAEDVWSAAAAATRINGGYLKEQKFTSVIDENGYESWVPSHEANKVLVRKLLDAGKGWTDEDVANGAEARAYWQAQLMKLVSGTANSFEQTAITAANKETIDGNFDLAVISSLIQSAARGKDRDAANDAKYETNSTHQGKVGENTVLTGVEVLTVGAISDFGKYRVDAKHNGNLYTWWSGKQYQPGETINVKGKIKGHIKDRATNVAVTQINYVKEV